MKNSILHALMACCVWLFLPGTLLLAQEQTAQQLGFSGGQRRIDFQGLPAVFGHTTGHTVATPTLPVAGMGEGMAGFPGNVLYFPEVFDRNVFISKGYFADYVQLRWNIRSAAERITRFRIFRKELGDPADSVLIRTLLPDEYTFQDASMAPGKIYKYTIFAEGLANELRLPFINIVEGVGFSLPTGTAVGRITYEGGTAVPGVSVLAEPDGGEVQAGKSLFFNGVDAAVVVPHPLNNALELRNGFTFQTWTRYEGSGAKGVLMSKGPDYELSYTPGALTFKVGSATVTLPFIHSADTFFHVSASYQPGGMLRLYAQANSDRNARIDSATAAAGVQPLANSASLLIGTNDTGDFWKGHIDEVRLWSREVRSAERLRDFSRYLAGTESGLIGYWRFNEGIGESTYDFSRRQGVFNEHHAGMVNATWSDVTTLPSQLSFKGITDSNGVYTIAGFPYSAGGTLYRFIPTLGVHRFNPNQQVRFVGPGNNIFNQVDFTDISSFRVTGTVRYRNSFFPVEGVSILVDGRPAIVNNVPATTDSQGRFAVDVPIGLHYIQLQMNLHGFAFNGRFPADPDSLFDFQEPLSGLEFIDTTLVKVAGRVVGGPREAGRPLGFGRSKNNLGNASIFLTAEKGFDVTIADSTATSTDRFGQAISRFSTRNITIQPDPESGEFVAWLIPERFRVTGVVAGSYTFGSDAQVTMDLRQFIRQHTEVTDTLKVEVRGIAQPGFPPFNPALYDSVYTVSRLDTLKTMGLQRFGFDHRQDFILRLRPQIQVRDRGHQSELFGDREYVYEPPGRPDQRRIVPLINGTIYSFGHPVFTQLQPYTFEISVFEEYVNGTTNVMDRVPVSDGRIEIANNMAVNIAEAEVLELNRLGRATYTFRPGLPNISLDPLNPRNSFTSTLNITAVTGQNSTLRTVWREGNPFRGIVFGGVAVGNDFVTRGPNQILAILRDPPGTDSQTTLERGQTITMTESWEQNDVFAQQLNTKFSFGKSVKSFIGFGGGIINEVEFDNDIEVGLAGQNQWTRTGERATSVTTTRTWSTNAGQPYVGSYGDVYIGRGTNMVYGLSRVVQLVPANGCTDCASQEFAGFRIGLDESMRISPEFTTAFQYTQGFILDQLIPNLKTLRNSFLVYEDPAAVNPTDRQMYVSLVPPDDPRYGTNNSDPIWGDQKANDDTEGNGPSYMIRRPASWVAQNRFAADTIVMFNNEVKEWQNLIARNEREKVCAILERNLSFDAGVTYTETVTRDTSDTQTAAYNWMISPSLGFSKGFTFNKFGLNVSGSLRYEINKTNTSGRTETNSTSYTFTLADGSGARVEFGTYNDYYSIDLKRPADGFGPVFSTRAGVSSCPYEGEERTQFFEPGRHILHNAMIPLEAPQIEVLEAEVKEVPSNRPAVFTLQLMNNSGARQGIWYVLKLDDSSNPNGARLEIDGAPLTGNGREFFVPFGQTVNKTLMVFKGRDDVDNYENLRLTFGSICDDMNPSLRDDVTLSAFFVPGCTNISMLSPVNNWVLNTNNQPTGTLNIRLRDYDLNNPIFKRVLLQYKPAGSTGWTTEMIFYNRNTVSQAEFDAANQPKAWIETGEILYPWNMGNLPDRRYDVRAVTICEPGPGVTYETPTNIATGIKDTKRPRLFGAPQPADGILSAGEEISIRFDEEIEAGLLTPFNFSVQGVLNGYQLNNNTSVFFDGQNDYVRIPDGLSLQERSFTIEWWQKRDRVGQRQVIFSKGISADDQLEIGFLPDNRFFLKFGPQEIRSAAPYDNTREWQHFAVVYNRVSRTASVYLNDQFVIENAPVSGRFTGDGSIVLGKSGITNDQPFAGALHELRIWDRPLQLGTVVANMGRALGGTEIGLIGYWPFDEAFGRTALDKARFRHATLFAGWQVLPKGSAWHFNGTNSYVALQTGNTIAISPEMDLTIEFWMKGDAAQAGKTIFSSGKGDGSDAFHNASWSIGFDASGRLQVLANGQNVVLDGRENNVLDNNWHHIALTVRRQGNLQILVDGTPRLTSVARDLGPLFGAEMWLGARGFKTDNITTRHDQFFRGAIDEFRIWNVARTQEQIAMNMTAKLAGDEMGLAAYYPFETFRTSQGVQLMTTSLADQWRNPFGPNGGEARFFGPAGFNADTPNIRLSRPVSKVDFDWVVNRDQIIILPSPTMSAAIERTMLEITVDRIEDKFENRIASPISWTAFVDRNQLKWGRDRLMLEKKLNDPLSVKVEIINKGGTQERFSISNLPPWLTASPSSGVINPLSTLEITLSVNPGLNTGTYQQDLFLVGSSGFDEKLVLTARVFKELPSDWKVNPADYQYSMNVMGALRINGRLSTDLYDLLSAFVGDECRGVANLEYVPQADVYLAFMTIYSNKISGEPLIFKIWDDSEGVVYTRVTPDTLRFEMNRSLGVPLNPVVFTTSDQLQTVVEIPRGWKWLSFNLESAALSDLNNLFGRLDNQRADLIKGVGSFAIFDPLVQWQGSLQAEGGLRNEALYMTNFARPQTLRYSGSLPNLEAKPLTVRRGWNWIGYLPNLNLTVNEALSRFPARTGDVLKSQYQFAVYTEGLGWLGSLRFMVPGEGYMLFSTADQEKRFTYPASGLLGGRTTEVTEGYDLSFLTEGNLQVEPHQYEANMSVLARVVNAAPEGILLAYVGEELRGIAHPVQHPQTKEILYFLSVFAHQAERNRPVTFRYLKDGAVSEIEETLAFETNALNGRMGAPVLLHLRRGDSPEQAPQGPQEWQAYPNPFTSAVDVYFEVPEGQSQPASVEVYSVTGALIRTLWSGTTAAGGHTIRWEGQNQQGGQVPSGIYFIRVHVADQQRAFKVVRQ